MSRPNDNRSHSLQNHSTFCSGIAGLVRGVGEAVLSSTTPVDLVKKTVQQQKIPIVSSSSKTPQVVMAAIIPGFFSFEAHHQAAHWLFANYAIKIPKKTEKQKDDDKSYNNINWEIISIKIRNHQLHFLAGSVGGLAYGIVLGSIEQKMTFKGMRGHTLGHGALFGGYDCFHDIFEWLIENKRFNDSERSALTSKRALVVGLSGGSAGVFQSWVKQLLTTGALAPNLAQHFRIGFMPTMLAFLSFHGVRSAIQSSSSNHH